MKIFIGADHGAKDLEKKLINYFKDNEIEIEEVSLSQEDNNDDYPDYAFKLCHKVLNNKNSLGILICRDGIGMSIAANKVKGIRCARVLNENEAFKAKNHSGANVIALGSENGLTLEQIITLVDTFIMTKSPTEERRLRRIEKIIEIETGEYNEL